MTTSEIGLFVLIVMIMNLQKLLGVHFLRCFRGIISIIEYKQDGWYSEGGGCGK